MLEEFTTERCENCPRVAGFIHEVIGREAFKDRVNVVCHHAGFYTDKFTTPSDEEMLWLYADAGGSVYAPAVLIDRQPYFEKNGKPVLDFMPSSPDNLAGYINYELGVKANAVVGVNLAFNADSTEVTVTVNGLKNDNYTAVSPHLCVYLLEDEISSTDQSGATGVYIQQHVKRGFNSTWGDPMVWDGNKFSYTYTFTIAPTWVKKNMQVMAMLFNYDPTNRQNCMVDNSTSMRLISSLASGIAHNENDSDFHEVARYTPDGQLATKSSKGVVFVKMSDGSTKKMVIR